MFPKDLYRNVRGYIICNGYKLETAHMFINNRLMNCGLNKPPHTGRVSKLWLMDPIRYTASLCLVHELSMVFTCLCGWEGKEYLVTCENYIEAAT